MTEIIKKFRVLEDGKYRIAVKVSGGSRLSEILLGETPIDFGFVRSIGNQALFLSDVVTGYRGREIFFKILSDSPTFVASEFRTFFRSIGATIKFQDIVAEKYEIPDVPGGGGEEPEPPEPPDPPEVDYGPDLTPAEWYPGLTKYEFTGTTVQIPITEPGVYQLVVSLAEPYFIEGATVTGGDQWNPSANVTTPITEWVNTSSRYYYNSKDSIRDELILDYASHVTVTVNTSDPDAPYRKSAVLIKKKRDLDVYNRYVNRVTPANFSSKNYIAADGTFIGEGITIYTGSSSFRLVAFKLNDDIKRETTIPDANTLMVVRYGTYSAKTPYKFSAAGDTMWPAKGTVNILSRKMGSDGNMYFRWISREIVLDHNISYPSCQIYRAGSVAKYQYGSDGTQTKFEITNPATGKTELVKFPNGLTTTVYGYAKISPYGRLISNRRIKISSNFDVSDPLQAWRNAKPVDILDKAGEEIKKARDVVIVVEMVQSTNSENYDQATNSFKIHSTGNEGRIFVSPYAEGEDGIDYASIETAKDYKYYLANKLVKTEDGRRYLDIWKKVDMYSQCHRLFFNVTDPNVDGKGSVKGDELTTTWFVLDNDPSHVYHFIVPADIFGSGSKYNANAAKRIMAYPDPGQDVYISILDRTAASVLSSTSEALQLPLSL